MFSVHLLRLAAVLHAVARLSDLAFRMGSSVDELHARIARLGSGDFLSTIPVAKGMENSVVGWLSETQIELAQIETERKAAEKGILSLAFYDPSQTCPIAAC